MEFITVEKMILASLREMAREDYEWIEGFRVIDVWNLRLVAGSTLK